MNLTPLISLDVPLSYSFNPRIGISNYISHYFILYIICFFSKITTVFPLDTWFFNKLLNILFVPIVPAFIKAWPRFPNCICTGSTLGHLSSASYSIPSHSCPSFKQHRNLSWNPKDSSAQAWKMLCQPACYLQIHYTPGVTEEK